MSGLTQLWNINLIATKGGTIVSLGDVVLVLTLVLVGYLLSRFIELLLAKKLNNTDLGVDAVNVIRRISFYLIVIFFSLLILSLLGIPMTAFAFATGAIAIGVGFGAQNIINNFISGWILIAERPIRTEDLIEIEGAMGVVKKVGTRSTLIQRTDGVHLLVPNSKLLDTTVINWTLVDDLIRSSIKVGVAYGSNIPEVHNILRRCLDEHPDVLQTPAPEVFFEDFGDSALIFEAFLWAEVGREKTLRMIRSDLRFAMDKALSDAGISIAFPQRDIHLHTSKPLNVSVSEGA